MMCKQTSNTIAMDVTLPAFPAQALRTRLGAHPEALPWAAYLPAAMRCSGKRGTQGASPSCSNSSVVSSLADSPDQIVSEASRLGAIKGRVWSLSRDAHGCRVVQHAIEISATSGEQNALGSEVDGTDTVGGQASAMIASELRGHILEALRCPHANHVVQKLISSMRPDASQFIIDELSPRVECIVQAARHKYGCRIVQRLIEHCPPEQTRELIANVLIDAVATCKHAYGNYVMQHLLKHGTEDQRLHLLRVIQENVADIGQDTFGCAVISAAMSGEGHSCQISLARAILSAPGLLQFMARARHGHLAAKLLFQALPEGAEREAARTCLAAEVVELRTSRFGSSLAAELDLSQVSFEIEKAAIVKDGCWPVDKADYSGSTTRIAHCAGA